MLIKRFLFALFTPLLIASGFFTHRSAPQPQPASISPFGINAHLGLRFEGSSFFQERAATMLDDIGVTWTREEFSWAEIEPDPSRIPRVYRLDDLDRFSYQSAVRSAAYRQINILGLLTYGPGTNLLTGNPYNLGACPPVIPPGAAAIDDWLPAWQDYVRYIVAQFGDHIDYWEIQNEQNSICFWHKVDKTASFPNPDDYVKVLQAAYQIIKEIDPGDQVLIGGMCPNDSGNCQDYYEYLKRVVDAGGWDYIDLIAIHPYRSPSPPEEVRPRSAYNVETLQFESQAYQYNLMDEISAFKTLMQHWGQKPIWITEIGWSTYALEDRARVRSQHIGYDVPAEAVQSDYLIRTYVQAIASGVDNILWYDFRDDDARKEDGSINQDESSMGIVYRDYDADQMIYPPKPAYYAFAAMSSLLTDSIFVGQIRGQDDRWLSGNDLHEYRFTKGDQTIIVLWKSRGGDELLEVSVADIDASVAYQYGPEFDSTDLNASNQFTVIDNTINLPVNERPLFIVFGRSDQPPPEIDPEPVPEPEPIPIPGEGILDQLKAWFQDQVDAFLAWLADWAQEQLDLAFERILLAVEGFLAELCTCSTMPMILIGGGWLLGRKRRSL